MGKDVLGIQLFDIEETADMLGVSISNVRGLIKDGMLKARKIGKKWYATRDNIKDYVNHLDQAKTYSK